MAQNAIGQLFRARCLRQTLTPLAQTRNQSTKAVPSFGPSSSPDLEKRLSHIRSELFAPMYLAKPQQRLTFRKRYHDRISNENIVVTIGSEEFVLQPRTHQDLPSKHKILEVVEAMKTPQDWQNFTPLLIGCRHSRYLFGPHNFQKFARLAGNCNALGAVIESAKQWERTGFTLDDRLVGYQLALALHNRAADAGFKGEEVAIALRQAEQLASLMDAPEHRPRYSGHGTTYQPFFIGVLLELSAARALEQGGGINGDIVSYARKLLTNWHLIGFDRELSSWHLTDKFLGELAIIHSGLKLAQQVDSISGDVTLKQAIQARLEELEKVIADLVNNAHSERQENPSRGLKLAAALLGK
ncbi:hypothetical protein BGW36DRAFT_414981 [Talaromyces proteolyticus]|uniref:Uncharacterized protein n=1 Tax=Talaromyces proteolyticus TaxID=1131652 RepID=A0AAD4L2X4_9EURO|nr:uncharacterized protein BGW36DRAFT_414981 [Talaromyces proteolyticus]KAH8702239.1 hypothetical protein BGW36DRAFT_414981 [Talaromyces proteolyticus]